MSWWLKFTFFVFLLLYIINNKYLFFQVSELKRINKLIRDQDLYALKKIKIPVVRYGCVQEQIEKEETNIASACISANAGKLSSYKINIFIIKVHFQDSSHPLFQLPTQWSQLHISCYIFLFLFLMFRRPIQDTIKILVLCDCHFLKGLVNEWCSRIWIMIDCKIHFKIGTNWVK